MSQAIDEKTGDEVVIIETSTQANGPGRRHARGFVFGDGWIAAALALVAFVARIAFAAREPSEWDSVHYVRALDHFDLVQYWPHAPGYWLYIFLGRLIRWTTPLGGVQSLIVAGALASATCVALAYLIGKTVANRRVGLACALVLMTNPFVWFYGSIVATKSFDALALLTLLWLAILAKPRSKVDVVACCVLGLAGGLRPSAMVLFAPLTLYIVICTTRSVRRLLLCLVAGAASIALWLVPMSAEQPGGLKVIREQSQSFLDSSLSTTSVLVGSPGAADNAWHALGVTLTAILPLVPLFLVGVVFGRRRNVRRDRPRIWLPLALATIPGLLEAFLIHFSTPGYALSFLPGLILAMVLPLRRLSLNRLCALVIAAFVGLTVGAQVQRFAAAPYVLPQELMIGPWSAHEGGHGAPYRENAAGIDYYDNDQTQYRDIRNHFDPQKDVLIYLDSSGGYRYRYAGYQLPEFTIHLVRLGFDIDQARRHRHTEIHDQVIEVPAGGRAVFVTDGLPKDLDDLKSAGKLKPLQLATGPTVYSVDPVVEIEGVRFINAPLPQI